MNNSSNFEQEPIEQIAEGELSDEALEAVAVVDVAITPEIMIAF
jgi:hypothetical protein